MRGNRPRQDTPGVQFPFPFLCSNAFGWVSRWVRLCGFKSSHWRKKIKKVLDKCYKVWYNESTTGEGEATTKCGCPRERVRPLPNEPTARCVGLRYTNVNQSRPAEEMTDYAYYKADPLGGCRCTTLISHDRCGNPRD